MPSQREGTASHRLQHAWRPSSCESTSELRQYKLLIPTEISRDVHLPLSSAFAVWPQSESRQLQRYSECRRATYVCSSSWLGMPASSQAFPRLGTHPRIARALIVVGRLWHIHMREPFAWWPGSTYGRNRESQSSSISADGELAGSGRNRSLPHTYEFRKQQRTEAAVPMSSYPGLCDPHPGTCTC